MTHQTRALVFIVALLLLCPPPWARAALTMTQADAIRSDLALLSSWGFASIRIITFIRYPADPGYAGWPGHVFITFPEPTETELENLREYLGLISDAGLSYEFMFLMPDSSGQYFTHGVTAGEYLRFIDAVWPLLSVGRLDALLLGGDLCPAPAVIDRSAPDAHCVGQRTVKSHRAWLRTVWPVIRARCPACTLGAEVGTAHASLWDAAASQIAWLRAHLPGLDIIAVPYYGYTTPAGMQRAGYRTPTGRWRWGRMFSDWYAAVLRAAGPLPVRVDEVGLYMLAGWSPEDQAAFFGATVRRMSRAGLPFFIWAFGDPTGAFGLVDADRVAVPAVKAIRAALRPGIRAGVQYYPPDSVGWQFMMPAPSP